MVQKSHSQPPGMYKNPVNNGIFTISTGERRISAINSRTYQRLPWVFLRRHNGFIGSVLPVVPGCFCQGSNVPKSVPLYYTWRYIIYIHIQIYIYIYMCVCMYLHQYALSNIYIVHKTKLVATNVSYLTKGVERLFHGKFQIFFCFFLVSKKQCFPTARYALDIHAGF